MPVAAVEIGVNLKSYDQQTKDGRHWHISLSISRKFIDVPGLVIATCKELGIAVVAYGYAAPFRWRFFLLNAQQSA